MGMKFKKAYIYKDWIKYLAIQSDSSCNSTTVKKPEVRETVGNSVQIVTDEEIV
jgi:hypothetical protein